MPKILVSKAVNDFYNSTSEEDRLLIGLGPWEFERNRELIGRFLTASRRLVADIGGGTGKYAEWLAGLGHRVTLVEPVIKHVNRARKRAAEPDTPFEVVRGEARHLDLPDGETDLAILHGPLYHLQRRDDRIQALREAVRITRPGGTVLGWAISYTASTLVALIQGLLHEPGIYDMCLSELKTGIHEAPPNLPGMLAEAFYHRPEELRSEAEEAGLDVNGIFAVEGMTWLDKQFFSSRADPSKMQRLLELTRLTEEDPNVVALSPHIMVAGRKL